MKEINERRVWVNERGNSKIQEFKIQGFKDFDVGSQKSEVGGKK
jgi:hypothetical protein